MAKTANYNLQKDSETDFYCIDTVNNNLDLIDSVIKNVENSIPIIPESLPANGGNAHTVGNVGVKSDNSLGLHKIQAGTTDIGVGATLESGTLYVVYEG